jgi:tRNA A37 threonylcarbamoyltransferase TsaD
VNILAIETSCDETSVAIVRDGREVLANIIASQIGLHQRFGGVVPELASRQHIITLIPTLEEAMRRAGLDWDGIDAIAVTCGPGLAGALLVGLNAAKAIAFARNKPLIAVNHLEAHIYSNWIIPETLEREGPPPPREHPPAAEQTRAGAALRALGVEPPRRAGEIDLPPGPPAGGRPQYAPPPPRQEAPRPDLDRVAPTDPAFPLLCLVVSGGHTELAYMSGHGQYSLLGKTVDDAAGEAFDKVARVLGLPYPGGPAIQRVAAFGDPDAIQLPRTVLRGSADFSFSGLKTAVLRQAQNYGPPITPEEQAAEREAAERARREEEARIAAEERAQREAAERARREEEARREAEERARREAEERARWEADEQARREAAEERRAAAATRRAEEERALQEDADRRAAEARTRRPAPAPTAEDRPRRAADTSERPAISILGGGRAAPRPAPPAPAPEAPPAPAGPPAEAEAEPPATKEAPAAPRKSRSSGLIRVTPESIRPEAGPPPGAVERFDREAAPPITVRPERDTPRVLGKT